MSAPRPVLFSTMRNEAPFILEWVAYHRAIGFDRIVVVTNDCTDNTEALLNALADAGALEHLTHSPGADESVQTSAARTWLGTVPPQDGDWVLWLDADEYLNVAVGDGTVRTLAAAVEARDARGITLNWRIFGDGGNRTFPKRLVSRRYMDAAVPGFRAHTTVKTLYRYGPDVETLYVHKPLMTKGFWESGGTFLNGDGKPIRKDGPFGAAWINGQQRGRVDDEDFGWGLGQINHYFVRTPATFLRKADRGRSARPVGDASAAERYGEKALNTMNRNEVRDTSILRHMHAVRDEMDRLLADAQVKREYRRADRALRRFEKEAVAPELAPEPVRTAPSEVAEIRGVKLAVDPDFVAPEIIGMIRRNRYETAELVALERMVRPGDRLLELGTGLGLISARAALHEHVEHVVTYEANPALLPHIRDTYRLNGVEDRVDLRNRIVTTGEASTTLPFYVRKAFWSSSLSPGPKAWEQVVDVETESLNAVIAAERPTIMTVDIEGGELELLEGTRLDGIRALTLEIHPDVYGREGTQRIFDLLSSKGFAYDPRTSRGGSVVSFARTGVAKAAAVAASQPSVAVDGPRVLVTSCMKNEGPFVLDWLAHHRAIGLRDFVIFSNDCTDGTDTLLARLDARGIVRHLPNPAFLSKNPAAFQPAALAYTQAMLPESGADYVLSMDVDEYVNITTGEGRIADLFAATGPVDALSLSEINFGADGVEHYEDLPVTERFTFMQDPAPRPYRARRGVKTFTRIGTALSLRNHRPVLAGGQPLPDWRDGSGAPMPEAFIRGRANGIECTARYGLARLNHYATRDMESFLIKRDRGDVVHAEHRVGPRYWRVRNQGSREDLTIRRLDAARQAERAILDADAETARLHAACVAAHRARIAELRIDPDYADFLEGMRAASA